MASTTTNPTVEQGGGPGTEGQPADNMSTPAEGPSNNSRMAILWWALAFLFILGAIWVIVRVISGAWHIRGK